MNHPAYRGGKWRRIRLLVLERDGYRCQIGLPGCTKVAQQVDHVMPVLEGGAWHDPDNLRGACAPCNQKRKRKTGGGPQQWRLGKTRITLVVGPEHVDLTHWVREHANERDVIVDDGALAGAIGNGEAVQAARAAIITRLRRAEIAAPRAWITTHDGTADLPHHRVVKVGYEGPPPVGGGGMPHAIDETSDASTACDDAADEQGHTGSRTW